MIDYECHGRKTESTQHAEVLREVAFEAGGSAAQPSNDADVALMSCGYHLTDNS